MRTPTASELLALDLLSDRQKEIILLRFGLRDGNPKTLKECGLVLEISRERVRQIESKAIKALRRHYATHNMKAFFDEL